MLGGYATAPPYHDQLARRLSDRKGALKPDILAYQLRDGEGEPTNQVAKQPFAHEDCFSSNDLGGLKICCAWHLDLNHFLHNRKFNGQHNLFTHQLN
jgi:hypothetical protein